jgi:hypothetical protein
MGTVAGGGTVLVVVVDGAGGLVVEVLAGGFAGLVVEVGGADVDWAIEEVVEDPLDPAALAAAPKGHPARRATAAVATTQPPRRQLPLRYDHIGARAWHTATPAGGPVSNN